MAKLKLNLDDLSHVSLHSLWVAGDKISAIIAFHNKVCVNIEFSTDTWSRRSKIASQSLQCTGNHRLAIGSDCSMNLE